MRTREAAVLALGMVLGATALGIFHWESRRPDGVVRVTGAATKAFDADVLKWRVTLARTVVGGDMGGALARLTADLHLLLDQLRTAGVVEQDVTVRAVNTREMFDRDGRSSGTKLVQDVLVISSDVDKLESLAINPASLLATGVLLDNSYVEYHSSRIADLKHELLAAATTDARARAEQIAHTSGARLGALRSARSGVFQIREPYSASADDYGMVDTSTRHKEITVTVHAEFELH
jgi:hypothetical protein